MLQSTIINVIFAMSGISPGGLPNTTADKPHIERIMNIALSSIGALALLIITVSGFRYITAAGDPQKSANARNGIIYALVGLVVAILADAIVLFIVNRLNSV